jgi:IS30 family transposase
MLSSSRRVKKGPGRRPQSAKRRRFIELRERGLSIDAAAREVGASRTAGRNWANGYRTYRDGQVVGFRPALERLAVREISARFLSQDERIEIADLHRSGVSMREIARRLGRAPSTISRELRRNASGAKGYRPFEAHRRATTRRARHHRRRVDANVELHRVISELLSQRWSPQQISRQLRFRFPDDPTMWLGHESIYQALYQPVSSLMRPSPLAPQHRSPLRTGRDHRRAQQRTDRRRPRFEQPMLTIHQRPFPPEDRAEAGHWEGDLIIGKEQQSAIGTLVEPDPTRAAAASAPA